MHAPRDLGADLEAFQGATACFVRAAVSIARPWATRGIGELGVGEADAGQRREQDAGHRGEPEPLLTGGAGCGRYRRRE